MFGHGLANCKAAKTPLSDKGVPTVANPGEPLDIEKYDNRALIGSVSYLANTTRPDLAFPAHSLAAFNNSPCENHWIAGKHILRYLQGTIDYKLIFTGPIKGIEMFCDSDFAGDTTTRKSIL